METPPGGPTTVDELFRAQESMADATVPEVYAWLNQAGALKDLGRHEDAVPAYEATCALARPNLDREPSLAHALANALLNLGELQGTAGRTDAAVAAFDEVIARFEVPGGRLLESAVHARYNRAVILRNANRPEATAAYGDIVDRYSSATDPLLNHWAGMAAYNKSLHLANRGKTHDAVAAVEDMERLFAKTTDPAIRERLARAHYFRALILDSARIADDALAGFASVAKRFERDTDDMTRRVVAGARRRACILSALGNPTFDGASAVVELDPAVRLALETAGAHVAGVLNVIHDGGAPTPKPEPLTLPEVLKFLREPQYEARDDADLETKNWVSTRQLLRGQLERDLKGHLRCAEILRPYLDRSEPFALFLRNFDIEGYVSAGTDASESVRVSVQFTDKGLLESRIAATLAKHVPFIGVGNNSPVRPDFEQHIPRILLRNEGWQEVVEELVGAASLIVMDVVRMTPGVVWELDTLRRLQAQGKTVIVLSEPRSAESVSEVARLGYGAKRSSYRLAVRDSAEFASFTRLVHEVDLTDDSSGAPWISDLLRDIRTLQTLEPTARPRWDGVVF